jgi:hypothetical protein
MKPRNLTCHTSATTAMSVPGPSCRVCPPISGNTSIIHLLIHTYIHILLRSTTLLSYILTESRINNSSTPISIISNGPRPYKQPNCQDGFFRQPYHVRCPLQQPNHFGLTILRATSYPCYQPTTPYQAESGLKRSSISC